MPKAAVKQRVVKVAAFMDECLKEKGIEVDQIAVFGSQVNGRAQKDSDIDIIIVSRKFRGKNIFKRVEMIAGIHSKTVAKFMAPIDILLKTPEEARDSHIFNNGVVVWAA